MLKLFAALCALVVTACTGPTDAAQAGSVTIDITPTVNLAQVLQITCEDATASRSVKGTAFYIGGDKFLTAEHVASEGYVCLSESGVFLKTTKIDKTKDISLLIAPSMKGLDYAGMPINCGGYKTGKSYLSLGYALGEMFLMNKVTATKRTTPDPFLVNGSNRTGMRELDGLLIQGMSGGPIINVDGEVIGINNVTGMIYTKAYSYQLKDTFMCEKA